MKKVVMVEEYDGEGKLVKRTVTTEEEMYPYTYPTYVYWDYSWYPYVKYPNFTCDFHDNTAGTIGQTKPETKHGSIPRYGAE